MMDFADRTERPQPFLAPLKAPRQRPHACNDNGEAPRNDALLHAALRQFAKHGIGAAEHARAQAEQAFFSGDRETYKWWLGICRTLDRQLAARFSAASDAGVDLP